MTALRHGPEITDAGIVYRLWSTTAKKVSVLVKNNDLRESQQLEMKQASPGWFSVRDENGKNNDLYEFLINDSLKVPDVASRFQSQGIRGPSQVMDARRFAWKADSWKRPDPRHLIIYEMHVGTFTVEGTFVAAIDRLGHLKKLGVNAIQLMPVGAFPGKYNWGYDVVLSYSPADCYGTPDDLRRLIDAAHQQGLAVILDVVYNHVCGEPDYLRAVSSNYFHQEGGNAWGSSLNFDEPAVRAYFIQNAEYWLDDFRVDGLRLDATHAIRDNSPVHVLGEISETVHRRGGFIIAEDDRNEIRLLKPIAAGGLGMDAVWADDFHHALKMSLKPEPIGHFKSYQGSHQEIVETLDHGWLFRGQYFEQWKKPRGAECRESPAFQFVYCISNHDQTGNRPLGERLNHLVRPGVYRAASMFFLLLPYTPMLFMGQEWAASSPFVFFTDHGGSFGAMVNQGRLNEFKQFGSAWPAEMLEAMPNPESINAFTRSKLDWQEINESSHAAVLELYRECLELRQADPVLRRREREHWKVWTDGDVIFVRYGQEGNDSRLLITHLGSEVSSIKALPGLKSKKAGWEKILSSNDVRFGGDGLDAFDPIAESIKFVGPETLLLGSGA